MEKRNDIVKPNISPNKQGNSTSSNDSPPVSASVTPKTTPPATSTNATSKKADEKKPEGQEPKVNILQVGIIQTMKWYEIWKDLGMKKGDLRGALLGWPCYNTGFDGASPDAGFESY